MECSNSIIPTMDYSQKIQKDIPETKPVTSHFTFSSFSAARSQRTKTKPALRVQLSAPNLKHEVEKPLAPASQLTPPQTPRSTQGSPSRNSPIRRTLKDITPVEPSSAEFSPAPSAPNTFHNYLRAFYPFHPESSVSTDQSQSSITIPINQGDIILVHSVQPNGWADGTLLSTGARGWLPTNYCEAYDAEVMGHLCNALTYMWEFIGERQEEDLAVFTRQDYVRGVIAGVRVLLEKLGCLNRDSPCVQSHAGLRRQRKGLLGDLSAFVKTAKHLTEQCQEGMGAEMIIRMLEEVLLRAFKVVTRAARFLDIWTQDILMLGKDPVSPTKVDSTTPSHGDVNGTVGAKGTMSIPMASNIDGPNGDNRIAQNQQQQIQSYELPEAAPQSPLSLGIGLASSSSTSLAAVAGGESSMYNTKNNRSTNMDNHYQQSQYHQQQQNSSNDTNNSSLSTKEYLPLSINHQNYVPPNPANQDSVSLPDSDLRQFSPTSRVQILDVASSKETSSFLPVTSSHTTSTLISNPDLPATTADVINGNANTSLTLSSNGVVDNVIDVNYATTTGNSADTTATAASASSGYSLLPALEPTPAIILPPVSPTLITPQTNQAQINLQEQETRLPCDTTSTFSGTNVAQDHTLPPLPSSSSSRLTRRTRLPSTTSSNTCPASPPALLPLSSTSTNSPCSIPAGKRLSASHRASHSFKSSSNGRRHVLASEKLNTTHDAYLGFIGAFIGGHLLSRSTMELLIMTQQSVAACQALLTCVEDIWRRDFCRSNEVDQAKIVMHKRLAELVDATRDVFQSAEAIDNDAEVFLPEQGKRLMDAATCCVQSAGDCVAKTRSVLDRIGDFDLEPINNAIEVTVTEPVQATPRSVSRNERSPRRDLSRRVEKPLPTPPIQSSDIDPIPQPSRRPPPSPGAFEEEQSVIGLHADSSLSHDSLEPICLPKRASSLPRSSLETVVTRIAASDSQTSENTVKPPALNVDIPQSSFMDIPPSPNQAVSTTGSPERRDSAGASFGSSTTCLSNFRNSNESDHSHTSTRATTPDSADAGLRQVVLQSSFASLSSDVQSSVADDRDDVEAQLMIKTFAHELVYNNDGQVTGGSLPALIERLTTHDATPDLTFVNTFYLTFRLFTSPRAFAQALVDRFDYVGTGQPFSKAVHLRVYNIFKGWLENHWQSDSDAEALETIINFAAHKLKNAVPLASTRLIALTTKVVEAHETGQTDSSFAKSRAISNSLTSLDGGPMPQVNISKSQLNLLRNKNGVQSCNILEFDATELARQITIYTSKIFCDIKSEELLASEWTKKTGSKAVHVKALAALSTDLANLVAESILAYDDSKKRAMVIKQWVKIAKRCLELNNYDTLMAIICSLNSSMILRLHKTWAAVSQKTLGKLDYLKTVVDVSRNHAVLRQRVQTQCSPCLPFIGIYLTDLTFIDAGNQAKRQIQGNPGAEPISVINFDKYMKTAKVISDLRRFQVGYRLQPVPEMQDWINAQMARMHQSDQANVAQYYRRSLLLEPRESAQPNGMVAAAAKTANATGTTTPAASRPSVGRETTKEKFEFWSTFPLVGTSKEKPSPKVN